MTVAIRASRAALIEAGAISADATELVLFADLPNGTQIEGHAAIQTRIPGSAK